MEETSSTSTSPSIWTVPLAIVRPWFALGTSTQPHASWWMPPSSAWTKLWNWWGQEPMPPLDHETQIRTKCWMFIYHDMVHESNSILGFFHFIRLYKCIFIYIFNIFHNGYMMLHAFHRFSFSDIHCGWDVPIRLQSLNHGWEDWSWIRLAIFAMTLRGRGACTLLTVWSAGVGDGRVLTHWQHFRSFLMV